MKLRDNFLPFTTQNRYIKALENQPKIYICKTEDRPTGNKEGGSIMKKTALLTTTAAGALGIVFSFNGLSHLATNITQDFDEKREQLQSPTTLPAHATASRNCRDVGLLQNPTRKLFSCYLAKGSSPGPKLK